MSLVLSCRGRLRNMGMTSGALSFRGNQWVQPTCSEALPEIVGVAVRSDPMLDALRKQLFLNAMALRRVEAPMQFIAIKYVVLLGFGTCEIASRCNTTIDAVRMAKMRGMRNLRRDAGEWVDGFIEAIQDAR
jgi:hypothetical protein